jgi:hypothetical protein
MYRTLLHIILSHKNNTFKGVVKRYLKELKVVPIDKYLYGVEPLGFLNF